jgi:type IV secretion system protein VirB6
MFRLFTPLFAAFDTIISSYATTMSSKVMVAITPVLNAALVLWVIGWGFLIMAGAMHHPLREFIHRFVRNAVVLSFAIGAGYYQGTVAELVRTVPDDLATVVMGDEAAQFYTLGGRPFLDPTDTGSAEGALIDRAAGQGLSAAMDALEKGGVFKEEGIVFLVYGILLLLSTVALVAAGGAIIIVAKVVLGVLVALGPIFIASLLFDATRRFFERWVAMVVTYGLLIVLFALLFTFVLGIFGHYMDQVRLDGTVNAVYAIAGALVLSVVSILVLREAKVLAMGLSGGLALPALGRGWSQRMLRAVRGGE